MNVTEKRYQEEWNESNFDKELFIMKRSGERVPFNRRKIESAVFKANREMTNPRNQIDALAIETISKQIMQEALTVGRDLSVEEIQDMVENALMAMQKFELARAYITYRYKHNLDRKVSTLDKKIEAIIDVKVQDDGTIHGKNEEVNQENANKDTKIVSVQRDYAAGEWSREYTDKHILPPELVAAHNNGLIHIHDKDFMAFKLHNCCLCNLEDMLQNGTCISGTFIDTPKSFSTAATVASQIIAQVASQQYGGQTISLTHLAPFVNTSRKKIYKRLKQEMQDSGIALTEEQLKAITEKELLKEVESGCQTIQYQLITLQTTNGQAPFVTIFMYLNETKDPVTKKDLALLIEVMLKQRIQGVKNETGAYISPAFPKLIYCLEEDNIHEDAPYWYLTELAAKCSAKRLVPDYISEKQMLKLKGDVYPCMGCVDENEVITYKLFGNLYTESFKRMWNRLADYFEVKLQPNGKDFYMDTPNVEIYDQKVGFVPNHRVIKNHNKEWLTMTFSNGRTLTCTPDHPFETENRGVVFAQDLQETDIIQMDNQSAFSTNDISMKENRAWLYGFLLCDSTYYDHVTASIAAESENDIEETFCNICKEEFHLDTNVMKRKRGAKGQYKDLRLQANQENSLSELKMHLIALFEGKAKKDRHIPNEVFCWSKEARLAFLAGMIDADGYVNTNLKLTSVQIGSTNKELAIQQALLAQTLDMPAHIYPNHYRENTKDYVRYRVEFTPTKELLCYMVCRKKTNKPINTIRTNQSICTTNNVSVTNVTAFQKAGYSYDVTTESEHFTVSGLYSHNCRSFLTPDRFTDAGIGNVANALNYKEGEHKYYGRFNQGVVTINLVDVACSSEGNEDAFWQILDDRLDLCHQALRIRHELLLGTPSDVAPIQWQHGALARLKPGETIDKLLYNGYSTISLGYAGLAETVRYMKNTSHTSEEGKEFGMRVMQALNDACAKWKADENIDYSVYGTPLESTTYKFAKCLQRRFGKIKGVSDKNYITNSYH